MQSFTPFLRCCFIVMIVITVTVLSYMSFLYDSAGVRWWYNLLKILTALFFTVPTYVLRKSHDLHIHHVNIGMFCTVMLGYQNVIVTLLHGIANGVMIEGGARWGYDPIWEKKDKSIGYEYS